MNPLQRWYRRARYGEPIVVVSGLPRSGTSMAMKMLEAGGCAIVTDGVREADEDNPKGYFELERIKDLSNATDHGWMREARGKAVKIISYLLKDLPPDHNYAVIFMRRKIEEVIASQNKMLVRRGETSGTDDEKMARIFENDLWRVGYLLRHAPQFHTLDVEYKQVLEDPRAEASRIAAFLGKPLSVDRMVEVVDKALYRNRR